MLTETIISVIVRRFIVISGVFVLIVAASVVFALTAPRKYESRMKVLIKRERADPVVSTDASRAFVRSDVTESDVNSEIELITNQDLLRQTVLKHNLHRFESEYNEAAPEKAVDRAIVRLTRNLDVTPVRKASIIQVTYTSGEAARSAAVLSTIAELYLQDHLRLHRTPGAHKFFRVHAEDYSRQLAEAQQKLASFRNERNLVLLPEQKALVLRRVMETEQAMSEVRASLRETSETVSTLKSELAGVPARVVTQRRDIPNQYSVERLHTMLADLRNRRTTLLTKFRAEDRTVQELDLQIGQTLTALNTARELSSLEETTDVNPARQRLETQLAQAEVRKAGLQGRFSELEGTLGTLRARLTALDVATSRHDDLAREVREAEENLVLYSRKTEEARIADSLDTQKIANVAIAEAPSTPHLPAKPNVSLTIALGIVFGLFMGAGCAFLLEMGRRTFVSAEELAAAVGVPVLAALPAERI